MKLTGLSIGYDLGIVVSMAGSLLDWHNPAAWDTPPDSTERESTQWLRDFCDELFNRVVELPAEGAGYSEAIAGLELINKTIPFGPGPDAAELLNRESTRAYLQNAIALLTLAAHLIREPHQPRTENQQTQNNPPRLTLKKLREALGMTPKQYERVQPHIKRGRGNSSPVTPTELYTLYTSNALKPNEQIKLAKLMADRGVTKGGRMQARIRTT